MIPRMVSLTGVKNGAMEKCAPSSDYLVGEEPLEIRVGELRSA